VLEIIRAFEQATRQQVPYEIAGRRAGDAPAVYADPALAEIELGWKAELGLEDICRDAWNWQRKNPRGYG
jgi:UDP-glucose 4-epimerase